MVLQSVCDTEQGSSGEELLEHTAPTPRRWFTLRSALLCLPVVAIFAYRGLRMRKHGRGSLELGRGTEALSLAKLQTGDLGIVHEIYSYGAPATAHPAIEDMQQPDGCFRGLRSYTEDIFGVNNESHQVDAAAMANLYSHAKMPVAVLHWGRDSYYLPCPGNTAWPVEASFVYHEWRLHWEDDYTPRLKHITVNGKDFSKTYPLSKGYDFVILAYKSYDTAEHTKAAIAERLPGWKLVAKEVRESGEGTLRDTDPVMIVQQASSLDCALVFTGTNNAGNELTSSTTGFSTGYCGYKAVHAGYRNELWFITKALWPKLRPKLAKCNRVICVGHSMAGSLCEIFAGCANKKLVGDPDFEQQKWLKGTPEEMPEL